MRLSRRRVLQSLAAVSLLPNTFGAIRPAAAKDIILNDASKLNATPVAKVAIVTDHADEPLFASLRAELEEAAKNGRPVAVGGTRHSMGGQSLARGGTALAIDLPSVQVHAERRSYTVRAGTRWRDVIRALDPLRLSPVVMQSNHDFTVGGTLSVNAHGWPVPFGPFGSTVKSFRMMLADGTLMTCSREQNADLFRLAIGGYGLFGIVVDLELAAAPNWQLRAKAERMASEKFARAFVDAASDSLTAMLYGRLSVSRDDFLRDALMVAYRTEGPQPTLAHAGQPVAAYSFITRNVFRAQIGSDAGKRARWLAETQLLTKVSPLVTRNDLLNYPVADLADSNASRTDILHEYFVPPERLEDFLAGCRGIIPKHKQDLLNVTLRYLDRDISSTLTYAPDTRIAAVMLFVQPMTSEADADMQAMTEKLIDHVLSVGGSFYLPYRLHATREQVRKAYPRTDEFIAAKRRYDPQLRFRNAMWDKYFA